MIRIINFLANLPGIRYLLAISASRRQEALTIGALQHRISGLEQLARDLDAKLTEPESLERKTNENV